MKLANHIWTFKEELYFDRTYNGKITLVYDEEREFLDYVLSQYYKLRKDVNLPYDKNYVGVRKTITPLLTWLRSQKLVRKFNRWKLIRETRN